jgi:hypothetical protein
MAQARRWVYRDAARDAAVARWLLRLQAALSIASAAMIWSGPAKPGDAAALAIALVRFAAFLATAVVVLAWLYRANANARALGADDLMGSPAWAVGWFFVPLLNLVMPLITVRDTWKASVDPKDWQIAQAPATIATWWAFWLLSNAAALVALVVGLEQAKAGSEAADAFNAASALFASVAALLLAWIIGRIQAMQAGAAIY